MFYKCRTLSLLRMKHEGARWWACRVQGDIFRGSLRTGKSICMKRANFGQEHIGRGLPFWAVATMVLDSLDAEGRCEQGVRNEERSVDLAWTQPACLLSVQGASLQMCALNTCCLLSCLCTWLAVSASHHVLTILDTSGSLCDPRLHVRGLCISRLFPHIFFYFSIILTHLPLWKNKIIRMVWMFTLCWLFYCIL